MKTKEIKPCPFCGSEVEIVIGFMGLRFFKCKGCRSMTSFDNDFCNNNPKETLDFWNRRVECEHHVKDAKSEDAELITTNAQHTKLS